MLSKRRIRPLTAALWILGVGPIAVGCATRTTASFPPAGSPADPESPAAAPHVGTSPEGAQPTEPPPIAPHEGHAPASEHHHHGGHHAH